MTAPAMPPARGPRATTRMRRPPLRERREPNPSSQSSLQGPCGFPGTQGHASRAPPPASECRPNVQGFGAALSPAVDMPLASFTDDGWSRNRRATHRAAACRQYTILAGGSDDRRRFDHRAGGPRCRARLRARARRRAGRRRRLAGVPRPDRAGARSRRGSAPHLERDRERHLEGAGAWARLVVAGGRRRAHLADERRGGTRPGELAPPARLRCRDGRPDARRRGVRQQRGLPPSTRRTASPRRRRSPARTASESTCTSVPPGRRR